MRKRLLLLTALLTVLLSPAFAQKKELTGKIIDATSGTPISGVSILSDRKESTTSKMDGSFSLQVTNETRTLVISHVGYTTQTITIGSGLSFDIRLETASVQMDDVVVIGYGTQRKSHLTGAISKYKNEKLDEAPVSRLDQALQGKIAGVVVQNTSSEAGADPKIQVRGISSINAQAVPLVVVDGHVVPDGLSYVNPADVESIEVLKDAASSAIYGSRGANGVIIVTTKSGKAERTRYSFKASTGAKTAYELYPMLSMTEYGNLLFYEASLKAKDPSITAPTVNQIMAANERAGYVIENTLLGGRPTNWQDQAIRNATVHNLQMNVSGGNSALRYYISGGYQKDQGMMYHSEYDRFNLRTKLDAQLGKRVKLTLNVNPSYIRRERPSVNYIDFVRFYSFLPVYHTEATAAFVNQSPEWAHIKAGDFAQARHFNNRVYSGLMPDGSMWNTNTATSPFNTSNNTPKSIMENRTITSHDYRIQGSGDVTINLAKGLDFKTLLSAYAAYSSSLDFAKRNAQSEGSINRGIYGNRLNIDLLSEYTLNYNRQLGDHNFTLLGGFTAQTTKINTEQVTGLDYPSDNITTLNTALQIDQAKEATFNIRDEVGLLSYLGRINYSYKNKYLLSASYRADGSSYFAEGRKWGYFPAVSLGWMVTEEDFMQDVTPINNLKLRASYGATGNNRIPSFSYLDLLYAANYSFGSGTGSSTTGQAPSRSILGNADITWERTFMYNFGMDVVLFRNAINLSVDYYQSETEKLLLRQATMAFTGVPETWNNIGRLQNRGLEIELSTNNIRGKDFRWTTSANFAHNKNKVLELGDESRLLNQGERTEVYQSMVNSPLIQFYGYKTDGVWLSQKEIDSVRGAGLRSDLSNLFVPGGLKLVDLDGNDTIDVRDRTVVGTPYPKFTWGITNTFTYKAFDLSFMFQGVHGAQVVNGDPNYNETKRINSNYIENRWLSPMFPGDGKTPYSTVGFNWMLTDYVVEDASYYALRELIVGYTLPKKLAGRAGISSARLYFTAQNLYYHFADNYRGINPEGRFTSGPYSNPLVDGYQRGSFPLPKTFLFGLDINF